MSQQPVQRGGNGFQVNVSASFDDAGNLVNVTTSGGYVNYRPAQPPIQPTPSNPPTAPPTPRRLTTTRSKAKSAQPKKQAGRARTPSGRVTKTKPKTKTTRPKKEVGRTKKSLGGAKTSKKGKNVTLPRKGTKSAITRKGGKGTRARSTVKARNGKEGGRGVGREGTGIGLEGPAVGWEGTGVRQGQDQSSDDGFVVGRPYNERHDPDYRLSRRERLGGDESSEEESESEVEE